MEKIPDKELINDGFSLFFLIGMIIVYLPQFIKFHKTRSSYGFSPWFMFLGHTASMLSCINGIVDYLPIWNECPADNLWQCSQELFGFGLLIIQWLLFTVTFILYIKYFTTEEQWMNRTTDQVVEVIDREDPFLEIEENEVFGTVNNDSYDIPIVNISSIKKNYSNKRFNFFVYFEQFAQRTLTIIKNCYPKINTKRRALVLFYLSFVIALIALVITLYLSSLHNWHGYKLVLVKDWEKFLESVTTVMFCLHYIPQILETVKLQTVASLSLITLTMTCGGTFIWTYFLAKISGDPNSGIWIPYLVVGVMQFILLLIGFRYEIKNRRERNSLDHLLSI